MKPKLHANHFGGEDYVGGSGVARWSKSDGRRSVLFLQGLTSQNLAWRIDIDDATPPAVFLAAWAQALAAAGPQVPSLAEMRAAALEAR